MLSNHITDGTAIPEFVGCTLLDTIGLVIPGIDPALKQQMQKQFGGGAGGQGGAGGDQGNDQGGNGGFGSTDKK